MSAQAVGWTFDRSPYTGDTLVIHLAIADVVNDAYGHRFWMPVPQVARKARCSERTVQRALKRMCEEGYLELVAEGGGRGKPAEYRFLFPDGNGDIVSPIPERVTSCPERVTSTTSSPSYRTQENSTSAAAAAQPKGRAVTARETSEAFAAFLAAYPRAKAHLDRPATQRAWTATVAALAAEQVGPRDAHRMLTAAAERYAAECETKGTEAQYVKLPSNFLNDERWRQYAQAVADEADPAKALAAEGERHKWPQWRDYKGPRAELKPAAWVMAKLTHDARRSLAGGASPEVVALQARKLAYEHHLHERSDFDMSTLTRTLEDITNA